MDRLNIPEDLPIESKMVSRQIKSAQTQIEGQNAEIRKNVLKYDEVMNEQRKVIYKRRDQILDDADLRDEALEALADAVETSISTFCVSEANDEWDLEGLVNEITTFWPTTLTVDELDKCRTTDELYEVLMGEATGYYEKREEELGASAIRSSSGSEKASRCSAP